MLRQNLADRSAPFAKRLVAVLAAASLTAAAGEAARAQSTPAQSTPTQSSPIPATSASAARGFNDAPADKAAQTARSGAGVALTAVVPAAPETPPPADPLDAKVTISQFVDVPATGDARSVARYGGKIDGYFDIKGSAFGADDSLSVHIHPEYKYGESANGRIGLLPSNTQLFYPGEDDQFDLSINLTKRWRSGTSLTVGKVNVLDLAAKLPVVGGGGHEGFQNLAMALPPSAIVPGSIVGALLNVPTKKALFRFWVFDPQSQSRKSGFESPFDRGVAFLGSATFPVKLGGKPGYYAIKLAGSTRSRLATEALPAVLVPPPGSGFGEGANRGEFSAVLAAYQFLEVYPEHPGKGWGVFGQVYASAGDPTFLDRSFFVGVSGNPRFRPQDRFGLAWFRYSLTDGLVDALKRRIPLEDEEGLEAFYTFGITRKLRLTADAQLIDSAIAPRKTGLILGARLTANF